MFVATNTTPCSNSENAGSRSQAEVTLRAVQAIVQAVRVADQQRVQSLQVARRVQPKRQRRAAAPHLARARFCELVGTVRASAAFRRCFRPTTTTDTERHLILHNNCFTLSISPVSFSFI